MSPYRHSNYTICQCYQWMVVIAKKTRYSATELGYSKVRIHSTEFLKLAPHMFVKSQSKKTHSHNLPFSFPTDETLPLVTSPRNNLLPRDNTSKIPPSVDVKIYLISHNFIFKELRGPYKTSHTKIKHHCSYS